MYALQVIVGWLVIIGTILLAWTVWIYLGWAWPAIPAFVVGLAYLKAYNWRLAWSPIRWAVTLRRRPLVAIGTVCWSVVAGVSAATLLSGEGLLASLGAAAGLMVSGVALHRAARSVPVADIFSILDDQAQFEAFADRTSPAQLPAINAPALAAAMKQDVIGQDEIIDEIAVAVERRVRLRRPNKPLGVFMLVGATGSGKTELAKSLAARAFGGEKGDGRIVRFDANEMTEASSTQRLIGAPPGYAGCESGGQLTRQIKQLRTGVLLFDEIEKAHSDVFKVLMGLMDEARITEQSTGETVDASGFVILLTSNAKQDVLAKLRSQFPDADERRRAVKDTLLEVFSREQIGRIDDIFCFLPHTRRSLGQIVGKALFAFARSVGVELVSVDTDVLIQAIERHEKTSDYGVRELLRLVERAVVDGMLEAKDRGHNKVAIHATDGRIRVVGTDAGRTGANTAASHTRSATC